MTSDPIIQFTTSYTISLEDVLTPPNLIIISIDPLEFLCNI
jgi:hypothetical protein